jgi:hypothetical protein
MNNNIKIITLWIMFLSSLPLFAQHEKILKDSEVEGIYLTVDDFKNGILTCPIDKKHKEDKIKLKQFFISPEIVCIEKDTEKVYNKDSIFTINLNNGTNYQFINRTSCLIADTSFLYIYTFKTIKTEYKMSGSHHRSKELPITYYFFSLANHNTLYRLTLANLRKYVLIEPVLNYDIYNKFTDDAMLQKINSQQEIFN